MRNRVLSLPIVLVLLALVDIAVASMAARSESGEAWQVVGQIGGPTQAVDVQGHYAYVGVGLRLVVLDVSDPAAPTEVGCTTPFPYFVEDIVVSGTLAYVAAGGAGLRVVDVSDPAHPTELGAWDSPGYAEGVAVAGNTVYLADGPYGLRAVSVSDPAHPVPLGVAYDMNYAFDVAVSGECAYIAAAGAGLLVADVSDLVHPAEIGSLDTPGYAYGIVVSGTLACVADGWEGVRIVDVSNPALPVEVSAQQTPGWAFGVAISGTRAYVADAFRGMRVLDVSDPAQPMEVGGYEASGGDAQCVVVSGDVAYVADRNWGLRALSVADAAQPSQVGSYHPLSQAYRVTIQDRLAVVAAGAYGLRLVDFSDESRPQELGAYDIGSVATSVAVEGHYAYVSGPPGPQVGLNVIDISDPRHVARVGLYQGFGECRDVAVAGGIAYLATGDDLLLVQVSDPSHPTYLGRINMCEPDELLTGAVGLAVSGNLAYVATQMSGLRIVDVSNPTQPTLIGAASWPNGFLQDLVVAGGLAYVADSDGLTIVDVSDPRHPSRIGFCDTPGFAEGVALSGHYAYVADGGTGLAIIDVSDPRAPLLVATSDTVGYTQDVTLADGTVCVADLYAGVLILQMDEPQGTTASVALSGVHGAVGPGLAPSAQDRSASEHREGPWQTARPDSQALSLAVNLPAPLTPPAGSEPHRNAVEASTLVVTSPDDSGPGTLRATLETAAPGATIIFDPLIFLPNHPVTIHLASALPWLTGGQVTIDASDAGVILDGGGTPPSTCGLVLAAEGNVVVGLQLVGFPGDAIRVQGGAKNNRVGGSRLRGSGPLGEGNRLAGSGGNGVSISDTGTENNTVLGNLIGTDLNGASMVGNENGIVIYAGASHNVIGGLAPGEGNVISGNRNSEILVYAGTVGNAIRGNLIGTDPTGSFALRTAPPTDGWVVGVNLAGGQGNVVGPANLISGVSWGINVTGQDNRDSLIVGNYIGTNITGTAAIGNFGPGIFVNGGPRRTRIGGALPSERNVVSGNDSTGISVDSELNVVVGNYIGTDATGSVALGNKGSSGVCVGAAHNVIGGLGSGERNVISGNAYYGVSFGAGATENTVIGNYIGLDASGSYALSNGDIGLGIEMGAYGNRVERNVIVSTGRNCIVINDWGSSYNTVVGNLLGTDASGDRAVGGGFAAVNIAGGAASNRLGGTTAGERNVIVGGILFGRQGAVGNLVLGNYVGTDASGTKAIGTTDSGVTLGNGSQRPFVGGATREEGNVISNNSSPDGITIEPGVDYAFVGNNCIGTDASGSMSLGSRGNGIRVWGAEHNLIQGNQIAFNGQAGVAVEAGGNNTVRRNSIHDNAGPGIVLADGGNDTLPAPAILTVSESSVSGTACPGCTVEVFSDDEDEGRVYEGTTIADSTGHWRLVTGNALSGPFITATATDAQGNTSEFSSPKAIAGGVYLPVVLKARSWR
jgi:parallel beta-helix repeat protein